MSDSATPKEPVPPIPGKGEAKAMSGQEAFFADMHAFANENKGAWAKKKVTQVVSEAHAAAEAELASSRAPLRTLAKEHKLGLITASVVAAAVVGYALLRSMQRNEAAPQTWVARSAESSTADRTIG